ncbi:SYF2 splicing factor-domain-containing protein [Dipodascopsis tothii]|uniref:SYF2 splicing factor-domain-containing protein n=1 Tax=Dipodascopsis tothii TaxID=44089 RepID=UPI0034CE58E9
MTQSASSNKKELYAEYRRNRTDPKALAAAQRKKADAEIELAKHDAAEAKEDFERKRAWDWTIDESEKWDARLERKRKTKDGAHFANYADAAEQAYEREIRDIKIDKARYLEEKMKMLRESGELVEQSDGQLVAVDPKGIFYRTADTASFDNRPPKDAVDRLVETIRKGDEQRMKKSRRGGDEADVTYINEKNKQFNAKLSRYYDKYTKEIRDSFERGTAL